MSALHQSLSLIAENTPMPRSPSLSDDRASSPAEQLRASLEGELATLIARRDAVVAQIEERERQLAWLASISIGSAVTAARGDSEPQEQDERSESPCVPATSREDGETSIEETVVQPRRPHHAQLLAAPLSEFGLSRRSYNCLRNAGHRTLRDVATCSVEELRSIRAFGSKCLEEVVALLAQYGLRPGMALVDDTVWSADDPAPGMAPIPPATVVDVWGATLRSQLSEEATAKLLVVESSHASQSLPGVARLLEVVDTTVGAAADLWGLPATPAVAYAEGLVALGARLAAGGVVSPNDEVLLATGRGSTIDHQYAVRYFGLDGHPPETLEAIGIRHGVTRERVRQRVRRFTDQILVARPPLPFCEAMLQSMDPTRPYALQEWLDALPHGLRPSGPTGLLLFRTLADWHWVSPLGWYEQGATRLVSRDAALEPEVRRIASEVANVLKPYRSLGAVQPSELALPPGIDGAHVRSVLRAGTRWEALADGWWIVRNARAAFLGSRAEHVLSLLAPLSLAELRYGLRREMRRRHHLRPLSLPPRHVLRRILLRTGAAIPRGTDQVSLRKPRPLAALARTEKALFGTFDGERTAATIFEIEATMKAAGLSIASARGATTFSPLLARVDYGVYALLGSHPSPDAVAAARRRLHEHALRAVRVQAEPTREGLMVRYGIGAGALPPVFPLPASPDMTGRWTATGADGTSRRVEVREGHLARIGAFARRARRAGATEFHLAFDAAQRAVAVSW